MLRRTFLTLFGGTMFGGCMAWYDEDENEGGAPPLFKIGGNRFLRFGEKALDARDLAFDYSGKTIQPVLSLIDPTSPEFQRMRGERGFAVGSNGTPTVGQNARVMLLNRANLNAAQPNIICNVLDLSVYCASATAVQVGLTRDFVNPQVLVNGAFPTHLQAADYPYRGVMNLETNDSGGAGSALTLGQYPLLPNQVFKIPLT